MEQSTNSCSLHHHSIKYPGATFIYQTLSRIKQHSSQVLHLRDVFEWCQKPVSLHCQQSLYVSDTPWAAAAAALHVKGHHTKHTRNCFPPSALSAFARARTTLSSEPWCCKSATRWARRRMKLGLWLNSGFGSWREKQSQALISWAPRTFSCSHAANWLQVSYNNSCL